MLQIMAEEVSHNRGYAVDPVLKGGTTSRWIDHGWIQFFAETLLKTLSNFGCALEKLWSACSEPSVSVSRESLS